MAMWQYGHIYVYSLKRYSSKYRLDWLASFYILGYRDWHRVIDTMVNFSKSHLASTAGFILATESHKQPVGRVAKNSEPK